MNQFAQEYLARRARLGFAPPPGVLAQRMSRPRPAAPLLKAAKPESAPTPPEPVSLVDRHGWPVYVAPAPYDHFDMSALFTPAPPRRLTWVQIARQVAAKHQVNFNEMMSHRRFRPLVDARYEAWWRIKNETSFSYPQIGRFFNRDHTSVLWGVQQYELALRAAALSVDAAINEIEGDA